MFLVNYYLFDINYIFLLDRVIINLVLMGVVRCVELVGNS